MRLLATTTHAQPLPPPTNPLTGSLVVDGALVLAAVGVAGRLLVQAVKEGIAIWDRKEQQESDLTKTLIESVLESQRSFITALQATVEKIPVELQKLTQAIMIAQASQHSETRERLDRIEQLLSEGRSENAAGRREIAACHARLDALRVPHVESSE